MTTNPPTVAIFGVGPGLGIAAARAFGRRGAHVALVARQRERLDEYVSELGRDGIAASAYAGDMVDEASFAGITATIEHDLGPLEVAVYQTPGLAPSVASSLEVTVENERDYVDQLLFGSIHAASTLMAPMLERGQGSVVFTLGSSALGPSPSMSQTAIPQAGLRNHLLCLASEAEPRGVRVGILVIGGLILNSAYHRKYVPDAGPDFPGALEPDELASRILDLSDGTLAPECIVGPYVPQ
jgi:NAD(P)-dependent dehydrogenase (short-subunit alcohol dehydrogenase family)